MNKIKIMRILILFLSFSLLLVTNLYAEKPGKELLKVYNENKEAEWPDISEDINAKDEDGGTGLMYSSYNGDIETVKLFLEHETIDINAQDKNGYSALMLASLQRQSGVVKLLLKQKNIEINAIENNGGTALMMATSKGNTKVVKLLLEHKDIDVNIKQKDGLSALDFTDNDEIIGLLKNAGAN